MSWRDDCEALAKVLKKRLYLSQAAVGIRLLNESEEKENPSFLEKVRRPGKGLPEMVLTCQAMAMVRLYGWQVMVTRESLDCPTGLITLGWVEMSPAYRNGDLAVTPYNQTKEARARRMEEVPALPLGSVSSLVAGPVGRIGFEPHVVVVYCSPAQAMRLVQAALFYKGGAIRSSSTGAQGCSQYITKVVKKGEARYIVPGNGDRIFGHVEEGQMSFSFPGELIGQMAEAIELSHQGGQVYPVPSYVKAELKVPGAYSEATRHLRKYSREKAESQKGS